MLKPSTNACHVFSPVQIYKPFHRVIPVASSKLTSMVPVPSVSKRSKASLISAFCSLAKGIGMGIFSQNFKMFTIFH